MMTKKLSLLFFALALNFSLSSAAWAEVEVTDSGHVFEHISMFSKGPDFLSSFTCNTKESFFSTVSQCTYKCNPNWCMSTCSQNKDGLHLDEYYVEDCTADLVHVYGQNGLEVTVTRADYEAGANTWLISLLKSHAQFIKPEGKIDLNFSFPGHVDIIAKGKKVTVPSETIYGNVSDGVSPQTYSFEVILIPQESGLRQLAYFRANTNDIFMQLRGAKEVMIGRK